MPIEKLFDQTEAPETPDLLYTNLHFPEPPPDRPYVFINMVSTADGKILQGPIGSTAAGLGSPTDQMLMRRLEEASEAVMIGAGTLRPGPVVYPLTLWRVVITRTGDLSLENRFFTDPPGRAVVFAPESLSSEMRERLEGAAALRLIGREGVDLPAALRLLREEFGVQYALLEGGAAINYDFFERGLVDELFLTLAPKIKGGAHLPTVVDGPGLPGHAFIAMELLSVYRDESELYLRYRVCRRVG